MFRILFGFFTAWFFFLGNAFAYIPAFVSDDYVLELKLNYDDIYAVSSLKSEERRELVEDNAFLYLPEIECILKAMKLSEERLYALSSIEYYRRIYSWYVEMPGVSTADTGTEFYPGYVQLKLDLVIMETENSSHQITSQKYKCEDILDPKFKGKLH